MRNTIQKTLVLETVSALANHPTADEVYAYIKKIHPSISRSTVYRNLNQLSKNGDILRIPFANAPDHYDHKTHRHCHFHCIKCSKVYDYDISNSIIEEIDKISINKFKVTDFDIVFKGYCQNCMGD